ncbi:hypothetical protein RQP46_003079 [Phenoliferia psychrophenolica]
MARDSNGKFISRKAVPEERDILSRTPAELVLQIFRSANNPALTTPLSKSLLPFAITLRQETLVLESEARVYEYRQRVTQQTPEVGSAIKQLHIYLPGLPSCNGAILAATRDILNMCQNLTHLSLRIPTHGHCSTLAALENRILGRYGIPKSLIEIEVTFLGGSGVRSAAPGLVAVAKEAGIMVEVSLVK